MLAVSLSEEVFEEPSSRKGRTLACQGEHSLMARWKLGMGSRVGVVSCYCWWAD